MKKICGPTWESTNNLYNFDQTLPVTVEVADTMSQSSEIRCRFDMAEAPQDHRPGIPR